MSTRVAINGLGRIGRAMLKLVIDEPARRINGAYAQSAVRGLCLPFAHPEHIDGVTRSGVRGSGFFVNSAVRDVSFGLKSLETAIEAMLRTWMRQMQCMSAKHASQRIIVESKEFL